MEYYTGCNGGYPFRCFDAQSLFCYILQKNRIFYKKLEDSGLNVYLLEGISSPFLLGRGIYIEAGILLDKKMLRHIIMHEYCHWKQGDNFWVLVRTFCVGCNWYNPLVWLANDFAKRDCELACDEAVLAMLDAEEEMEYGYTLLNMAKYFGSRKRNSSIASAMSGDMRRMKERVAMIHSIRKQHVLATGFVVGCMICLTGCALMKGDSWQVKVDDKGEPAVVSETVKPEEISDAAVPEEAYAADGLDSLGEKNGFFDEENGVNKYCNVSARYWDGKTYIASGEGLYVVEDGSTDWNLVFPGAVTLGAITDGYLFFYFYPENIEEAAIMSLNVSDGSIETGLLLGDSIYSYREMYGKNGGLYINMPIDSEIAVFKVQPDGSLGEKETFPVAVPDSLQDGEKSVRVISPVISRSEGVNGDFYVLKEPEEEYDSRLLFYTEDAFSREIEGITDVMVTSKGVIGRDAGRYKDVYLWDMETGERKLFYSAGQNGDKYWGYNTYDGQGVYGLLQEDDNRFYISRIGWDGTMEKLFPIENADVTYGIDVRMSVIGDWIYYYNPQTDRMERCKK